MKQVGQLIVKVRVQSAGVQSFVEYLQDAIVSGDITPVTASKLEELLKGVAVVSASPDANVERNRQLQHLLEELLDAANYIQAAKNSVGDLQQAQDRLFDVLLGDDGQAHKEAERYLLARIPKAYTLNTGHVSFFYDKGEYLRRRYAVLRAELERRGINFNRDSPLDPDGVFNALERDFNHDYDPTPEALVIIRTRIAEKIALKPHWYRYEGKPIA